MMDERASNITMDYSTRNQVFLNAWEGRHFAACGGNAAEMNNSECEVDHPKQRIESTPKKVNYAVVHTYRCMHSDFIKVSFVGYTSDVL